MESADDDQHANAPPNANANANRDGDQHASAKSDLNILGHADAYPYAFTDAQLYADDRHEYANADLHLDT